MQRRLKVAHILLSLGVGGMEKVVVDIIKRFNREKIHSLVCCLEEKGDYAEILEDNGLEVFLIKKNGYPLSLPFILARLFRREKVDVVHSYSGVYRDATLGGLLARIPIIIHTDQGKFYPDSRWSRFNHWFFSHFRDKVVAVSEELKNFLIKEVKINHNKVIRIYNAVDVSEHNISVNVNEKKKELGIPSGDKIIGVVARFVPVKDHATLFLAFKKVKENFGNVKLLVIGDGCLEGALRKIALDLGEENNILFLGKREDVKELLHIMDIVCLSSLNEGLSLTLTEAMASGKPVVATNVGGNPELIVDKVSGLLVPPRNPNMMTEAIIELLKDEEKRKSMGQEARRRVEEGFNINQIVKEYEKVYFDLAKEKGIL